MEGIDLGYRALAAAAYIERAEKLERMLGEL